MMMRRILFSKAAFWLFSLTAAASAAAAQTDTTMHVNPVQVRIDPFSISIGPTNSNAQSTLSLSDAGTILGVVEDLVTNYARAHFVEMDDTEFKYAILALVELPPSGRPMPSATTVLEFSGGIGYFGGMSQVVPSQPEMDLLVDLSLNEEDLQGAIAEYFPFVTRAEYRRSSSSSSNNADDSGSNDPSGSDNANSSSNNALLNGDILDTTAVGDDSTDQFVIVVASASAAGLVLCLLVGVLAYLRQQRRKDYWREDAAHNDPNKGVAAIAVAASRSSDQEDAALEDLEGDNSNNNNKKRGVMLRGKQQSLHLRDSLQEMRDQEQGHQDTQSDAGSSRLGRLLSTAAASVLPAPCTSSSDGGLEKPGTVDRKHSNDTSSCSRSDEESIQHDHNINNNKDAAGDMTDDLTYASDFEGNAVIQPNLVAVPNNVDEFHEGGMLPPLPPPSRTASARRDELPISSHTATCSGTDDAFETPTKPTMTKEAQESFLAKYFPPLAGSVSLPYFGCNAADDAANDNNKMGEISPRTEATTPEEELDTDAHWSDISSELDLGNRTDDDFEMDKAWDPDDTSVNSSECGKDVFSPMSSSDEVRLLKSTEKLTYNLVKLRTTPHPPTTNSRDASPQRTLLV